MTEKIHPLAVALGVGTAALGVGTAIGGGVTIYDYVKGRGRNEHSNKMTRMMADTRHMVDAKSYVQSIDPKITVVTTLDSFVPFFRKELMLQVPEKHRHLIKDEHIRPLFKQMTTDNAAAFVGKHGEYIVCSPNIHKPVVDHEIGHVWDFRAKGITSIDRGPYTPTWNQNLWRPAYDRQKMTSEQTAWKMAPASEKKKEMQRAALGTYDKGFHADRAHVAARATGLLGYATAIAGGAAILAHAATSDVVKTGRIVPPWFKKVGEAITEKNEKKVVKKRFKKLKGHLETHGVMMGGHKRIAIPKHVLSEENIMKHLGFVPVKIAIPESGQTQFESFRSPKNNYHIHDHDTHWTMHRDEHPSATMILLRAKMKREAAAAKAETGPKASILARMKRKAGEVAETGKSLVGGVPHVFTEGVPGAYYYAKNKITRGAHMLPGVLSQTNRSVQRKVDRWRPTPSAKKPEEKTAAVVLKKDEVGSYGIGSRGPFRVDEIIVNGKKVGDVGYVIHPEGHIEVKTFFIDDEHQGKGYGREALGHLLKRHGAILSDTTTGTTRQAQGAFKSMMRDVPGVVTKEVKTKELDGTPYTDINEDKTSIWYANTASAKTPLTGKNLSDIEHNSRYHRRRSVRSVAGFGVGGVAGGVVGQMIGGRIGLPSVTTLAGMIGGGWVGGKGTSLAQHMWDKKFNLRGNW